MLGETRKHRNEKSWTLTANYSVFETWVLSKYGVSLAYIRSPTSTYEIEYMRGSVGFGYFGLDIGKIEEQRLSLLWRTYGRRNAFNFTYGVYYNNLSAHLGEKFLRNLTGDARTHVELMELETIGLSWGLGNRWQTKGGFVWGADWFTIHVPVCVANDHSPFINAASNKNDRENVKNAWNVLKRVPELAVAKIQLGVSF